MGAVISVRLIRAGEGGGGDLASRYTAPCEGRGRLVMFLRRVRPGQKTPLSTHKVGVDTRVY